MNYDKALEIAERILRWKADVDCVIPFPSGDAKTLATAVKECMELLNTWEKQHSELLSELRKKYGQKKEE